MSISDSKNTDRTVNDRADAVNVALRSISSLRQRLETTICIQEKLIDIAIIIGVALALGAGIMFGPLSSRKKKK